MTNKVKNAFTDAGTASGFASGLATDLTRSALGAISPLNKYAKYMTGSRAIIKINDQLFGFAFSVRYSINTQAEDVNVIDSWVPWELAPSRVSVSGTMGLFHIPGKSVAQQLVQPNVLSFLEHKYITIEISDRTTGNIIFKTNRAFITGKTQSLDAGELSIVELQWKAIGWSDEQIPASPLPLESKEGDPNSGLTNAFNNLVSKVKNPFG